MTDNLKLWNQFADIDPKFTKAITGKPYKGTSPNPHYVIMCLTEMFGPVGVGFGWEVSAEGFQPMGDELLHWCRIRFWHGDGPGFDAYGQTKAIMKTRNGFMSDEDAPKKSLTDAITKAAAQIGVASNIFLGRWDDSRYVSAVDQDYRKKEAAENAPAPTETRDRIKGVLDRLPDAEVLEKFWRQKITADAMASLPEPMQAELQKAYTDRMAAVYQAPPTADEPGLEMYQ